MVEKQLDCLSRYVFVYWNCEHEVFVTVPTMLTLLNVYLTPLFFYMVTRIITDLCFVYLQI